MKELHLLSVEERNLFFRTAADESQIPLPIVEKDFWVVWMLARLFSLQDLNGHLTFKGGTSLSKVYDVIERFSEDIDLSIEKSFFGFNEDNDPAKAPSRKKRAAAIEGLAEACSGYIQEKMITDLKVSISEKLKTDKGWSLTVDEQDLARQTLLFEYPGTTPKGGYIRPFVKIEIGARSEHWPVSNHEIESYAKETLGERMTEEVTTVKVLNAERTFWEKATILHQIAHLPEDKPMLPRMSRHYYDFCSLLTSPFKKKALEEDALLERVATHKSIYFASAWANYDTARKGTLRLMPIQRTLVDLKEDFKLMEPMFFGPRPDWKQILITIGKFEREFNGISLESKIIVNGRQKVVGEFHLSYSELVSMAFDNTPKGPNILFTITYRNGPKGDEEGTLSASQEVQVINGMIFNVTATDKS